MANNGKDCNGSQFFMALCPTPFLDKKHTVFGRIIHNFAFMNKIEENPIEGERDIPIIPVIIHDCGELTGDNKLTADQCDFLKSYDLPPEIP